MVSRKKSSFGREGKALLSPGLLCQYRNLFPVRDLDKTGAELAANVRGYLDWQESHGKVGCRIEKLNVLKGELS
jgi:hypothetical protein